MAYDVNTLKTRAHCLVAKDSLEAELRGYQHRDQNLDYQDWREGRAATTTASRLADATNQVTYLTDQLARPDLSAKDRSRYEDQLLTANYQKARLQNRSNSGGGAEAFLAEVDVDQNDAQVDILTRALADVQTRHDALPA